MNTQSLVVRQEDDHLTLQAGGPARTLAPLSPSEFFIKEAPVRSKFVKNAAGVVTELRVQNRFGGWHVAQKSEQPLPATQVAIQLDPVIYVFRGNLLKT